jgi:hypothetical protein
MSQTGTIQLVMKVCGMAFQNYSGWSERLLEPFVLCGGWNRVHLFIC